MTEPSNLERATESTLAKAITRFGVPMLLLVVAWFVREALADIKSTQRVQGEDINQIKSDVRDVNTRLDAQVLRQVETNTQSIKDLDGRVRIIERRFAP